MNYYRALFIAVNRILFLFRKDKHRRIEFFSNGLLNVKVKYVLDGDTVDVIWAGESIRVRLSAIDCPEDGQPGGNYAKSSLIGLIGGQYIYLESYGLDIHGRLLATAYVMTGSELLNVNEHMVRKGQAWVTPNYLNHLSKNRRRQLVLLERWARRNKVGLWKAENPVPPWHWRKAG